MNASVLLIDAKYPHNVGSALRACALLGAEKLYWSGDRVPAPDDWPEGARLPREERLKAYRRTEMIHIRQLRLERIDLFGTPVCVEISDSAEDLRDFIHPEKAIYVFGPEDGGVTKGIRGVCQRFVKIPVAIEPNDPDARTPYNLAAAVNLVLYDRFAKARIRELATA